MAINVFRKNVVEELKEVAQDIVNNAEKLIGNSDLVSDYKIEIVFGLTHEPAVIVSREFNSKDLKR